MHNLWLTALNPLSLASVVVATRYAVVQHGVNPIVLACTHMAAAAVMLLILAGPGTTGLRALRSWHSWAFGLMRVLNVVFYTVALVRLSGTESEFILKMGTLMTMVLAWGALGRVPDRRDLPGAMVLALGLALLVTHVEGGLGNWAVWCVVASAVAIALATFVAEIHPVQAQVSGMRNQLRYTGVLLLVSSIVVFAMSSSFVWFGSSHLMQIGIEPPAWGHMLDGEMLIAAALIGCCLRAPMMALSVYTIRVVKSEPYLMMIGISPFVVYGLEQTASMLGLMPPPLLETAELAYGVLIAVGSLMMLIWRLRLPAEERWDDAFPRKMAMPISRASRRSGRKGNGYPEAPARLRDDTGRKKRAYP